MFISKFNEAEFFYTEGITFQIHAPEMIISAVNRADTEGII